MNPQPLVHPSNPDAVLAWYCGDCNGIRRSETYKVRLDKEQ